MGRNKRASKVTMKVVGVCPVHGVATFKRSPKWNKKYKKFYYREECIPCSNDYFRERTRKRKIEAVAYKGGKCARCNGVFNPCVYDFHHLDPSEKLAKPSQFLSGSWDKLAMELDKCIMVCANCHRLIHEEEGY